jgi:hypothetical protein
MHAPPLAFSCKNCQCVVMFGFTNLCGTVYKAGNVVFTPDGNTLLSPVGNRITVFDLVEYVFELAGVCSEHCDCAPVLRCTMLSLQRPYSLCVRVVSPVFVFRCLAGTHPLPSLRKTDLTLLASQFRIVGACSCRWTMVRL